MSYTYDFWLKSVYLLENGKSVDLKGTTVLSVVLCQPSGSADHTIETIYKLPLDDRDGLLPEKEVYSVENIDFRKKRLFKKSLEGHVVAVATVAVSVPQNKLVPILKNILKGALTGGAGMIGGPGGAILVGATTAAIESIFKDKELKDKVVILGEAEAYLVNGMPSGDLPFNLTTPEEIKGKVKNTGRKNENGEPIYAYKIIPTGTVLGHVVISFERIWTGEGPEPALAVSGGDLT